MATPLSSPRKMVVSGVKWLTPGLKVKRFLFLIPIGLIPVVIGVALLINIRNTDYYDWLDRQILTHLHVDIADSHFYLPVGLALIALGLLLILSALIAINRSIVGVISPENLESLPEVIQRKRTLNQGARIVVIGGGTGLSTLLRGLKQYSSNLTAVVTMTDDGGSSGLLQQQLGGMPPPGDIRNCLVALADAEPLMQELFQFRFETRAGDDGLSGHSFGNLLIAAMTQITGDFETAVQKTSEILAIRGRVLPSTVESVALVGLLADGREVTGETRIVKDPAAIEQIKLCPEAPAPPQEVLEAIRDADIVVLGPGSVFTSVIPNLLVGPIAQELAKSRALRMYICNVMTQPGETDGFSASQHLAAIEKHLPQLPPGKKIVDYVLVNDARPSLDAMERYAKTGAEVVAADTDVLQTMGYHPITGKFLSETQLVRHDPERLSRAIFHLWQEHSKGLIKPKRPKPRK
ncbi:uridine diphosphate-N-acetylglucosamine-binding protein YvcK [Armatimonas rosea]|uniref:Putative gluconeogenesis factor n=1 Tax=Armatimonas rosea TaxID=685828 RepID=A0A7W9SP56_ARMRO|nr:putative cofD-like protein [Armatimonas rosea]